GVVLGGVTWFVAGARADDAVEGLARAAVGCDTTLDFAAAGDYLVYVETQGQLPAVRGDCDASGDFDLGTETAPTVTVSIVDPDGDEVTLLSRRGREEYGRAGASGISLARVQIDTPGDHVVRVESASEATFAVAIGSDPVSGLGALRALAIVVAVVGVAVGAVVMARSRGGPKPAVLVSDSTGGFDASMWSSPSPTGPPPMRTPSGPPATASGPGAWPPAGAPGPTSPGPPTWGQPPPPVVPTSPTSAPTSASPPPATAGTGATEPTPPTREPDSTPDGGPDDRVVPPD
ncbi:MAG: hypothetical protein AAGG08_05370, partial [Actinomycetota bacterium]